MKTVVEMIAERGDLIKRAEGILSLAEDQNRGLSTDEQKEYDKLIETITALNELIDRRKKQEELFAPAMRQATRQSEADHDPQAAASQAITTEVRPPEQMRSGVDAHGSFIVVRASGDGRTRIETPRPRGILMGFQNNPRGYEAAYRSGMWLAANIYNRGWAQDWCRQNGVRAAMVEGIDSAGGALVPEEFERAIIDLRLTYGVFRRYARFSPMGSDTKNTPRRKGGLTAYHVGEGVAPTESQGTWDNVGLVAKKVAVLTRMSRELSEDAIIDLASDTANEIAIAFAYREDLDGFLGDGTSAYGGIHGVLVKIVDGNHAAAIATAGAGHDSLNEIDSDDLAMLMGKVIGKALPGSAWYCSPVAKALIFDAILAAAGGNTMMDLAGKPVPAYLGYPIITSEVFEKDTTAAALSGDVILGFGNLAMAASFGDRRGVTVDVDTSVHFETDEIAVKGTERYDINVHDVGDATAIGPFAVLKGA